MNNLIKIPQIKYTEDLSQFKSIEGNRLINPILVKKLVKSISLSNLLHIQPVVVNKDMGVIDGQHRIEAGKVLKTGIYYIQISGVPVGEIILLNVNAQGWKLSDYLNTFVQKGKSDYLEVDRLIKETGLGVDSAAALLYLHDQSLTVRFPRELFIDGEFEVRDLEYSRDFYEHVKRLMALLPDKTHIGRPLIIAIYKIYINKEVDFDTLLDRMKSQNSHILKSRDSLDYLRQFEDIYNFNSPQKTRLY